MVRIEISSSSSETGCFRELMRRRVSNRPKSSERYTWNRALVDASGGRNWSVAFFGEQGLETLSQRNLEQIGCGQQRAPGPVERIARWIWRLHWSSLLAARGTMRAGGRDWPEPRGELPVGSVLERNDAAPWLQPQPVRAGPGSAERVVRIFLDRGGATSQSRGPDHCGRVRGRPMITVTYLSPRLACDHA